MALGKEEFNDMFTDEDSSKIKELNINYVSAEDYKLVVDRVVSIYQINYVLGFILIFFEEN